MVHEIVQFSRQGHQPVHSILNKTKRYHPFSDMAADHWCLSLIHTATEEGDGEREQGAGEGGKGTGWHGQGGRGMERGWGEGALLILKLIQTATQSENVWYRIINGI